MFSAPTQGREGPAVAEIPTTDVQHNAIQGEDGPWAPSR